VIRFNKPYITGSEITFIKDVINTGRLSGDGKYTDLCHRWITTYTNANKALLTHSCTAALEMSALLTKIKPGDEIIMPSYTFVSTANAFVLRGGIPVFVDIREDTLNINELLIEEAITSKTKAIVPVHYAGISCEMDSILEISRKYNLWVIEDAAQALLSSYKNRPLGSIGDFGCLSFHETKNTISGEGGALIINRDDKTKEAEIIWEKGTNRKAFYKGETDKYTWTNLGSSFLPSELTAAFLWAQLQTSNWAKEKRLESWNIYNNAFLEPESSKLVKRPFVPSDCKHNGHLYYLILNSMKERDYFLQQMQNSGINCVFHYIPLHSSPAGKKYGRTKGELNITKSISECVVRLPIGPKIDESQNEIIEKALKILNTI
jgi:dTDP-4-amino-4,6-dideoxygalactose transaminase